MKSVLIVVHGVAEHSGRYGNLVEKVVPRGYAVYGLDLPGHGRSYGKRCCITSFSEFTAAVVGIRSIVSDEQPQLPVFILGHSMGGLIVADFLPDHQGSVSGAILTSPGLRKPDSVSRLLIWTGKMISRLAPDLPVLKLDENQISRDRGVVTQYRQDPLVHNGKLSARLGAEMLKAMDRVMIRAPEVELPLLILQGGSDKMVNPDGTKLYAARTGGECTKLKIYDELYHEIMNEPEHATVISDIIQWLDEKVPVVKTDYRLGSANGQGTDLS